MKHVIKVFYLLDSNNEFLENFKFRGSVILYINTFCFNSCLTMEQQAQQQQQQQQHHQQGYHGMIVVLDQGENG